MCVSDLIVILGKGVAEVLGVRVKTGASYSRPYLLFVCSANPPCLGYSHFMSVVPAPRIIDGEQYLAPECVGIRFELGSRTPLLNTERQTHFTFDSFGFFEVCSGDVGMIL